MWHDILRLIASRSNEEWVARIRHAFETKNLDRCRWSSLFNRTSAIIEHGTNLAESVANDEAVLVAQRTVLNQHGCHGTTSTIELRFDDRTDCGTSRSCFQVSEVGHEAN